MRYIYSIIVLSLLIAGCKKEKAAVIETTKTSPILLSGELNSLKINDADCAFDSVAKTFYFPVAIGNTLNNYKLSFDKTVATDILFDSKTVVNGDAVNEPLTTNKSVKIQTRDKQNNPVNYTLIITGVPILQINENGSIGDSPVSGTLKLINPDYVAQKSRIEISSAITINLRGATARTYPKKPYLMHLVDDGGDKADISLLGLRSDNSWILDAMYIDQARMRNRVCTDVWNSFNNVPYITQEPNAHNGTRGYMTEVFINNEYRGLYCMTEKLDRKQLQISKDYGHMYKAVNWSAEVLFLGVSPYSNVSETWGGWQLEYPDIGNTPSPDWSYLYNLVDFVNTSTDADFSSQISSKVDISNMVDYYIFMNILDAPDNQAKNTYFSFYDSRNQSPFFYSVWDLDGTLGRKWDGTYLQTIVGVGGNNLFKRLIDLNPGNFKQLIKNRWNTLKNAQLSKSTINSRIDGYKDILIKTNAFARDSTKWGNITQSLPAETTYMQKWYSSQYNDIDTYINNL